MFLRDYGSANDWDREAALQALLIIKGLYVKDADLLAEVAGLENRLALLHFYSEYTWPPGWCVYRSTDDRFFMFWAGTTNSVQWLGHVVGSGSAPVGVIKDINFSPGKPQANLPWAAVAEEHLQAFIDELGPIPPGARFRCAGHSYGGAIAQVVASELIRRYGVEAQCMVFGSPKVWTQSYPGPFPEVFWRIESEGDVVTVTPHPQPDLMPVFANVVDIASGKVPEAQWDWIPLRWQHYGNAVVLWENGSTTQPSAPVNPLPEFVTLNLIGRHLTNNYFGRVRANALGGSK